MLSPHQTSMINGTHLGNTTCHLVLQCQNSVSFQWLLLCLMCVKFWANSSYQWSLLTLTQNSLKQKYCFLSRVWKAAGIHPHSISFPVIWSTTAQYPATQLKVQITCTCSMVCLCRRLPPHDISPCCRNRTCCRTASRPTQLQFHLIFCNSKNHSRES